MPFNIIVVETRLMCPSPARSNAAFASVFGSRGQVKLTPIWKPRRPCILREVVTQSRVNTTSIGTLSIEQGKIDPYACNWCFVELHWIQRSNQRTSSAFIQASGASVGKPRSLPRQTNILTSEPKPPPWHWHPQRDSGARSCTLHEFPKRCCD